MMSSALPRRHNNIDDAHSDQNAHNDAKDKLKQLKDLHVLCVLSSANAKCRSKQDNVLKQLWLAIKSIITDRSSGLKKKEIKLKARIVMYWEGWGGTVGGSKSCHKFPFKRKTHFYYFRCWKGEGDIVIVAFWQLCRIVECYILDF